MTHTERDLLVLQAGAPKIPRVRPKRAPRFLMRILLLRGEDQAEIQTKIACNWTRV
jgi:hypothetical protein